MTESLGILVRVRAGIDVISSEAFWDMQSIDPETGRNVKTGLLGI